MDNGQWTMDKREARSERREIETAGGRGQVEGEGKREARNEK